MSLPERSESLIQANGKTPPKPPPCFSNHSVQFYESDVFLESAASRFLGEGLRAGEPTVIIATRQHRDLFLNRLRSDGFDLENLLEAGKLVPLDAEETLARFMDGDTPDRRRFQSVMGGVLKVCRKARTGAPQAGSGRYRFYGEMVDLLWRQDRRQAAICLEQLWNELGGNESFSLLCAYRMGNFYRDADTLLLQEICRAHAHVEPAESFPWNQSPEVHSREIILLQQRARALESEVEQRRQLEVVLRQTLKGRSEAERALRRSRRELKEEARERARLYQAERRARQEAEAAQRRSAFLSEASALLVSSLDYEETLNSLARLIVPRMADWCVVELANENEMPSRQVAVAHRDAAKAELVREYRRRFAPRPNADKGVASVIRSGKSERYDDITDELLEQAGLPSEQRRILQELGLRSSLIVPMIARGQTLGAIVLISAGEDRHFEDEDLRMAEELAHRAALAIDNSRLYHEVCEAGRRKDEFLALLGHELRNPLAPILTALQVMRLRGIGGEREQQIVERQVRHLVRLIDDLLDVSRITRGKVELKKEPVEAAALLTRAIEISGPLYEQRHLNLIIDVPRQGCLIDVDPVRLAQVLSNLLTNAAKYSHPGGQINVSAGHQGTEVVISVKDRGIGISPELLPQVFDLFTQGERSLDRSQGGLGIGLTLARSLIQLHGGSIEALSEGTGRGSEFIIRLPALGLSETGEDQSGLVPSCRPSEGKPTLRILVVDDNRDSAELLAEVFRGCGHTVAISHDGAHALTLAQEFRPDTAVLDIGLPTIDGYELAVRLRRLFSGSALRLIAVTGYGQEADKARAVESGFDVHMVKPFNVDALIESATSGVGPQ